MAIACDDAVHGIERAGKLCMKFDETRDPQRRSHGMFGSAEPQQHMEKWAGPVAPSAAEPAGMS
ncbi:hypothetical protein BSIN_1826 [Burkholderia singularis]|uniref:Uncharacterized protein n=1 Tax=Burkholderia singularis TaxID=1503053 RepID=A0A238GZY4_9BURK|nr:hypothetical protein BSIN_1826 [Burkholderia singularis]